MLLSGLDTLTMLILIFVLCPLIQLSGALIGRKAPDKCLNNNSWLYRTRKWEKQGKIYRNLLVHKWKGLLPDGAKYFKNDFTKKHLLSTDPEYIKLFIKESCRAELVHWLGMLPFIVFFIIVPPLIAGIITVYALIVNLPCIIAQRYNRPRLVKLYEILIERNNKTQNSQA